MAKPTVDITPYEERLGTAEQHIAGSPTYYDKGTPSAGDLAEQRQYIAAYNALQRSQSQNLANAWYGDQSSKDAQTAAEGDQSTTATTTAEAYSPWHRLMQAISTPLYLTVGATEAITGLGPEKGISNIWKNVERQDTFGDVLRKAGAPGWVAAPVGLALDIGLDPIMWASAGTSAMIPKLFRGAEKAGLKGLGEAAKASALQKAATVSRPLAWFGAGKTYTKVVDAAETAKAVYNKTIGYDLGAYLAKEAARETPIKQLIDSASKAIRSNPTANEWVNFLVKGPKDWWTEVTQRSNLIKGMKGITPAAKEENLRQALANALKNNSISQEAYNKAMDVFKTGGDIKETIINDVRDRILRQGAEAATTGIGSLPDANRTVDALTQEFAHDIRVHQAGEILAAVGVTPEKLTGYMAKFKAEEEMAGMPAWYVKFQKEVDKNIDGWKIGEGEKAVAPARAVLDGLQTSYDLFKCQKIGNPRSTVYAIFGNGIFDAMMGMNPLDPGFLDSMKKAFKITHGKFVAKDILPLVNNPAWQEVAAMNPDIFSKLMSIHPDSLFNTQFATMAIKAFNDGKGELTIGSETLKNLLNTARNNLRDVLSAEFKEGAKGTSEILARSQFLSPAWRKALAFLKQAGNTGVYTKILKDGSKVTKSITPIEKGFYKVLHTYLTVPLEEFQRVDQTYRLGRSMSLVDYGVTETTLKKLGRFINIKFGEDVVFDAAKKRYVFTPMKAMEIANEAYMNYASIPAAVKIFRSLPFFGMPFAAFSYSMISKTLKTAAYNPDFYNKVAFALREISGGKSPLEREALTKDYYKWYNQDGMVALPFFNQPGGRLYLNLANYLPYYTMNIFEPSERKYTKALGGKIMGMIDAMPIFKTPEGQVLLNYFIAPMMLGEADVTGQFGQPLVPQDASKLMRYFAYPARSYAESFVGDTLSVLGLAPGIAGDPLRTLDWAPNYRFRQIGYAAQGKTPIGVLGKEPAFNRTARSILSAYAGLSFYPMTFKYTQ